MRQLVTSVQSNNQTLKLILGLILIALAGFLFVSGNQSVSQAQSNLRYTTNWQAMELMTVESSGFFGNIPPQEVAIGVAKWQVTGIENSSQRELFTEIWETPAFNGVFFTPSTQVMSGGNFNPSEWLFANHIGTNSGTPNGGKVTYRVRDLNFLDANYRYSKNDAKVGGNAIKCASNSDSNCLHMRGAYGWEVYHALSNMGSERGRVSASGVLMPLKWKVTGNLAN